MPSLTNLIENELLPNALRCGIRLFEFWEMTLKEIKLIIETFSENRKIEIEQQKHNIYNTSFLTALFVGCVFNGKNIPTISEVFPDTAVEETKEDTSVLIIKEKLLDFANEANKRRMK